MKCPNCNNELKQLKGTCKFAVQLAENKIKKKRITDEDGITYEEVSYQKYLTSGNKHRIVKSLEHQYFVECVGDEQ